MKQALNILLSYLTCTDEVMRTKWENILNSFWHKDQGQIITGIALNGTTIEISTINADGVVTVTPIAQYQEPANFEIAKITGLQGALDNKVVKVVGKALSTNDYTTAEKNKLANLTNYVHPEMHSIGEVDGLQQFLTDLQTAQNNLNATLSQLSQYQFIIWHGYRLYKVPGNTETYPEAQDELQGRGEGQLEGGDIVHLEVLNAMPDITLVVEADYKFLTSYN